MAFVEHCTFDVFLSYAWKNDTTEPWPSGERRWVTEFRRRLAERIDELLPGNGDSKFFKDTQTIPLNEDFEKVLEDGLRNSAVLIALMSTRYRFSKYCQFEARRFAELHGGPRGGLAETGRAFVVNLENIHPDQWKPDEPNSDESSPDFERWFGKLTPVPFYSTTPRDGCVNKYHTESREFSDAINLVATHISRQLGKMRNAAAPTVTETTGQVDGNASRVENRHGALKSVTVTLGACGAEEEGPSNDLERRLANDVRVLRTFDIEDQKPWRDPFIEKLNRSDLFVQLIGERPTQVSDDAPNGLAAAQVTLARKVLGEQRVLLWRPWRQIPATVTDADHLQLAGEAEYFGSLVEFAGEVRRLANESRKSREAVQKLGLEIRVEPEQVPGKLAEPGGVAADRAITEYPRSEQNAPPAIHSELTTAGRKRIALVKVLPSDDRLYDAISLELKRAQIASLKARNGLSVQSFIKNPKLACVGVVVVQGECDDAWLSERAIELVEVDADLKELAPIQAFYVERSDASLFYETESVLKVVHGDAASVSKLIDAIRLRGPLQ